VVEPELIPEDEYYVLGDSRRNSFDSHAFAPVNGGKSTIHADYIIGEAAAGQRGKCER
jgi:type IV secretory pathway protease TraF